MSTTFALPTGFRFGVATAGFQIEGGYNGPGQPANNWHGWEADGRVERSGPALDFWNRYEQHLDRAVAAGCDSFRLSVEWARCEPAPGQVDHDALNRYGAILEACHRRGLEPLVTLHHFTHPAWLGVGFWRTLDAPERFAEWVQLAVAHLGSRCTRWVTINEINAYALNTWLTGLFPPGRKGDVGGLVRTLDHMLAAHVAAYDVIHATQQQAVVTTNNYTLSVYELDSLLVDVLLAPSRGVGRHDLRTWLVGQRERHEVALPAESRAERLLRRVFAGAVPLEQALPRAVAAVYASASPRCLDTVCVDWYAPQVATHLRLPGHRTAGGRRWSPQRALWDDPPDPAAMAQACRREGERGLAVWVGENGVCNRVVRGRAHARLDGWDRGRYLREHLAAVVDAVDAGVDLQGYWHWTLADNYEWGSYQPRFGLHAVDRDEGLRWSDLDSFGDDAAGEYRRLVEGLRAGDRSVVAGAGLDGSGLTGSGLDGSGVVRGVGR